MKFGKTLQQQIFAQNGFPGWSSFFCDYKGLKKVPSCRLLCDQRRPFADSCA